MVKCKHAASSLCVPHTECGMFSCAHGNAGQAVEEKGS